MVNQIKQYVTDISVILVRLILTKRVLFEKVRKVLMLDDQELRIHLLHRQALSLVV